MDAKDIKVGDFVRVREGVTEPKFNWGNVTPESIGQVKRIHPFKGFVEVDFPEHEGWRGVEEELEVVKAYGADLVNEREINRREDND